MAIPLKVIKPQVSESVVRQLKGLLESAEKGELQEIMAIGYTDKGDTLTIWTPSSDLNRDLALASRLVYRINSRMDQSAIIE